MKIKSLLVIFALLALVLTTDSCKIKSPVDGAKLIVNYDILKTTINLQFTDAATGNLIGSNDDSQVKITITGPDADAVLSNAGIKSSEYFSVNGFIGLALNPNTEFVPTATNKIKFTVVASLDGFIKTSKSFSISAEGNYNEKLIMTNIQNPPKGVVVQQEFGVGNLSGGVLQEELNIKTSGDEANLTIPAGTIIKDAGGNDLSGSLDITLVYFDNLTDESLAAFPGGLMTRVNQDGETQEGAFFSAGFVAIEITDQNGVSAETFGENTVALSIGVQAATYNPETANTIAANDDLPVYSYNPNDGEWNYEQTVSVESGGRSDFTVTAQLSHLSYWNFDWFWTEYCPEGIKFLFTGDFGGCECHEQWGIIRKQADNTFFSYIYLYGCANDPIQTYYAPANMPVYIEWLGWTCSSSVIDEEFTYIDNLCAPDIVELNLIAVGGDRTTVTVDIMGRCTSNPDVEVRPTVGGWFRPIDDNCWRWAFMYNGYSEICDVEIGKEYVLGTWFNGQWYETTYIPGTNTIVEWDIELPADFCNQIF